MLPPYIRTGRLTVWDEDIEIDSAPPYVLPLTTAWNAPIGLDALTSILYLVRLLASHTGIQDHSRPAWRAASNKACPIRLDHLKTFKF